ncbi:amidophosphoribosyltransferase [Candidatus Woesearchaeota archaeon]|nr:amidophosphoribosyltransferase [Candidatus Woesearchaeota archaeon]
MCGIIGIIGQENVAPELYAGLIMLQHRGQDAAGINTCTDCFHLEKGLGLVQEVFTERKLKNLKGTMGIGHVRYPTAGYALSAQEAQPFILTHPYGISIAHNGNSTNYGQLRDLLINKLHRQLQSSSDSEAILNILAEGLLEHAKKEFSVQNFYKAVAYLFQNVKGSYSMVGLIGNKGLYAVRDPHGIRPLILGKKTVNGKENYMFASESCALSALGYSIVRDVAAGEAFFIDREGNVHHKQVGPNKGTPCIFEYVYFARPDSIIDKISVYKTRLRLGKELAKVVAKANVPIDVVVPVPDTSRACALALAAKLKVKYREGLLKNRYIGRTFIMHSQELREVSVKFKLTPVTIELKGKRVLLVDDSIVRGTTSKRIIQMVRNAGARKVYFASSCPPIRYPDVYGIDMQTRREFIARDHSIEEIKKIIGADALFYQTMEGMIKASRAGNPAIKAFCTACFDGNYPTGDVTPEVLKAIEEQRILAKSC